MTTKQAINRIGWRFGGNGNKKPFPVNAEDIEAFNQFSEYYEQTQKQQFEANELFAKLYIFTSMRVMEKEGSTVFDNSARRRIGNILKKPLSQIIQELQQSLNDGEQYGLLETAGHDFKHPALRKGVENTNVLRSLNELLKTAENVSALTGDVWDYETVEQNMMAEINQQINIHR